MTGLALLHTAVLRMPNFLYIFIPRFIIHWLIMLASALPAVGVMFFTSHPTSIMNLAIIIISVVILFYFTACTSRISITAALASFNGTDAPWFYLDEPKKSLRMYLISVFMSLASIILMAIPLAIMWTSSLYFNFSLPVVAIATLISALPFAPLLALATLNAVTAQAAIESEDVTAWDALNKASETTPILRSLYIVPVALGILGLFSQITFSISPSLHNYQFGFQARNLADIALPIPKIDTNFTADSHSISAILSRLMPTDTLFSPEFGLKLILSLAGMFIAIMFVLIGTFLYLQLKTKHNNQAPDQEEK